MKKDYGRRVCPGCGRELPEELHFCLYCMARLDEDEAEAVVATKRKNRKIIVAVLLCLALCLAGAAGYYFVCPETELPGAKTAWREQSMVSMLAEVRGKAEALSDNLSGNIVAEVQAQLGLAAGKEVLVIAYGDTPQNDTSQGDTNLQGDTVNPPSGETVVPLAGWFIADIPQLLVDIKEEFQRRGVTAEIVTTYEEYQNSTLRKLGGAWDVPVCWDDFYLSYMPGRPCGEEYQEQQVRQFANNTVNGIWDVFEENPEIIAIVFDRYEYIDPWLTGEYNQKEIWVRVYY